MKLARIYGVYIYKSVLYENVLYFMIAFKVAIGRIQYLLSYEQWTIQIQYCAQLVEWVDMCRFAQTHLHFVWLYFSVEQSLTTRPVTHLQRSHDSLTEVTWLTTEFTWLACRGHMTLSAEVTWPVCRGHMTHLQRKGSHSRVCMFINIVRLALVTSVTWTPPFIPPVRCWGCVRVWMRVWMRCVKCVWELI